MERVHRGRSHFRDSNPGKLEEEQEGVETLSAGIKPEEVGGSMVAATKAREHWTQVTARGEIKFKELVTMSKMGEYKALQKIRLLALLEARPGWSKATALEALRHAGFDSSDNVLSIRRSPSKIENFAVILELAQPGQWRARPKMPDGWPWSGKMEVLAKACGIEMNPELATMGDDLNVDQDTGEIIESETPSHGRRRARTVEFNDEDLESLFGGDS